MNEKKIQQVLHEIVEEEIPSQSVNLVSKVKMSYQQKASEQKKKGLNWEVGFAALLLVGVIFLTFTPLGRVIAEGVLDFFIREDSDVVNMDTTRTANALKIENEGTPTPNPAYGPDFFTVEEVEAQAGFDMLVPEWIPENLAFKGASFDATDQTAIQHWELVGYGTNGLSLSQEHVKSQEECSFCTPVGASAIIEEVSINGVNAEYVIGVWKLVEEGAIWENEPWIQRLRWQVNNMAFQLSFMGPPEKITIEELVQIAESFQ